MKKYSNYNLTFFCIFLKLDYIIKLLKLYYHHGSLNIIICSSSYYNNLFNTLIVLN